MKKLVFRLLQVILILILVVVAVNILEPLRPVKLSEENRKCLEENVGRIREGMEKSGTAENTSKGKNTVSEEKERIACIDDNEEALLLRLRMIEAAKEEVVFATFDFREDESGSDMMAAFYAAAERGVKVKLLLDGMNEFLYLERSERFRALCTHENVELRIYNPIDALHILNVNYRMHDKYLITDEQMYLLAAEIPMIFFSVTERQGSMRTVRFLYMKRKPVRERLFWNWKSTFLPSGRKTASKQRNSL